MSDLSCSRSEILFVNSSQMNFSNYSSPVGLFNSIFCLTNFLSDVFDFSSSKTG